MNRYLILLMGVLCAGTILAGGCSSARKSKKGESCEHSLECESGDLACKSGTCALADFSLKPTGKLCSVYECTTPTECCLDINDTACQTWKAGCSVNDPPSDTNCRSYEAFCKCNVSQVQCSNGQCKLGCSENDQCGNGLECTDGRCVECTNDAACAGRGTPQNPYVCENSACVPGCTNNADCSGGRNCFVGHCADDVTCTTNRECIAYTKNVEAFCRETKCIKPCETDLDCDSPTAFKYNACVDKECKTVGCESARECELYSGIVSGDKTGLGRTVTVQCQTAPAD